MIGGVAMIARKMSSGSVAVPPIPGRVYATGRASLHVELPPFADFTPPPALPAVAVPAELEPLALLAAVGLPPPPLDPPPESPMDVTLASGSPGLDAPAPSEPRNVGLAQLSAVSCSGALPCIRAIEFAISWERFGGNGE